MKFKFLMIALCLSACSSNQVGLLSYQKKVYPKLEESEVQVVSHTVVPSACEHVSIIMTEPEQELNEIIEDIRKKASHVGGNFVNIDTLAYVDISGKGVYKYATATVYRCP